MKTPYAKPHLSVSDQVSLLGARGLVVTDRPRAEAALGRIGYYRLAEYWHAMREPTDAVARPGAAAPGDFKPGATFADALDLYVFDKRLRLLMLDAIERVEVALRVDCAHNLGARGPYVHRDPSALDARFAARHHTEWLAKIDRAAAKSREDFVARFVATHDPPLPIWVSVECWDFGALSFFISGLRTPDKTAMAARYGLPRRDLLTSWVRALNHLRNTCAHHGRLWNAVLVERPSPPRPGEHPLLEHLAIAGTPNNRLYSAAVALQWFMRTVNPESSWPTRLARHFETFPASMLLDVRASGFPAGWEALDVWRS